MAATKTKHNILPAVDNNRLDLILQVLSVFSLLIALKIGLLPALISGLLVYHLVDVATPILSRIGIVPTIGKLITLIVIATIVTSAIVFGAIGLSSFLNNEPGGLIALLQKMADVLDTAKAHLPLWVKEYLPANVQDLQIAASKGLREYAAQLGSMGRNIGISFIYILTGLIIGGMVAYSSKHQDHKIGPLTLLLIKRAELLHTAFSRIVFSQIRISAINTLITGIYLAVILPLCGITLPFTKTMIAVTFIVGLLPVIGNLISNTVIVLISLSYSHMVAVTSLTFLVLIHKLEYFLNAHIIGTRINARAWELLIAMLVMEAAFGLPGIIAAPIYYAYFKDELSSRKLI